MKNEKNEFMNNCWNCIHYVERYFYGSTAEFCHLKKEWCHDLERKNEECKEFEEMPQYEETH